MVDFYHVAEKLMIPDLQDMIMGCLLRFQKAQNQLPSLEFIRRAYEETTENGKLRLYAVFALHYLMKQTDRNEEIWPLDEISAIIQNCDGVCKDFLLLSMKQETADPRNLGVCTYHMHGLEDICPVTGKRSGGDRKPASGDGERPAKR